MCSALGFRVCLSYMLYESRFSRSEDLLFYQSQFAAGSDKISLKKSKNF